jgi:hypothetical protein
MFNHSYRGSLGLLNMHPLRHKSKEAHRATDQQDPGRRSSSRTTVYAIMSRLLLSPRQLETHVATLPRTDRQLTTPASFHSRSVYF